uniref:Uncharacterized protein n=1 Tax=Arundo donax TaxID=35708 RepID=A0A0A9Q6P1_ARUDO
MQYHPLGISCGVTFSIKSLANNTLKFQTRRSQASTSRSPIRPPT